MWGLQFERSEQWVASEMVSLNTLARTVAFNALQFQNHKQARKIAFYDASPFGSLALITYTADLNCPEKVTVSSTFGVNAPGGWKRLARWTRSDRQSHRSRGLFRACSEPVPSGPSKFGGPWLNGPPQNGPANRRIVFMYFGWKFTHVCWKFIAINHLEVAFAECRKEEYITATWAALCRWRSESGHKACILHFKWTTLI